MKELWSPVEGSEFIEVSSLGRVRSWKARRNQWNIHTAPSRAKAPHVVSQQKRAKGYLHVSWWENSHHFFAKVHVLVLEAFDGPRPPGLTARHLNGNPSDNRIQNLCWGTHTEQGHDRIRHGTLKIPGTRKLSASTAASLRREAPSMSYTALGQKYGISKSHAWKIVHNQRWTMKEAQRKYHE